MSSTRMFGGATGFRVIAAFVAGAFVGALSAVEILPNFSRAGSVETAGPLLRGNDPLDGVPASDTLPGGDLGPSGVEAPTGPGVPEPKPGLACQPGRNGGATDRGVTATEIKMATTVVESGIGAAFLKDVRFAMEAVRNEVNRAGGICGRKLTIDYIDDGWDAQRGAQFIRNFADKIFALPIGPSTEGLRVVISSGDIDKAQLPVVGADGMLIDQYVRPNGSAQPWVWPVATATVASARIMARQAHAGGARTFGVVFDKNFRFGQEAARAFNSEVKRLTDESVRGFNESDNCQLSYCGIQAGQSSYANEVVEFYRQGGQVDFTALFLEPQTALTWMNDPNAKSAKTWRYGAAQPLFTRAFAVNCQEKCDQMMVWTGFKPAIERYKTEPGVQRYVKAIKGTNPQADEFNAFVVGGYVGMRLLVEALQEVGPDLTRARLKAVLDRKTLRSPLTYQPRLLWKPSWRWVNTTMQGFTIQYKGTFGGWREGPIASDPLPDAGVK